MKNPFNLCLFLALFIFATTCSLEPDNKDDILFDSYEGVTLGWDTSTPEAQGINADTLQLAFDKANEQPSMYSLLVIRNGFLIKEKYYNKRKPNTLDPVRSVTKSYMAALFGLAWSMGFIDSLDQRLLDILPEYDTPGLDPRKQKITLRHLLTMQAGFDSDEKLDREIGQAANLVEAIIESDLIFDPGSDYQYTSFGSHLLSAVIAKTTNLSTIDFGKIYFDIGIQSIEWQGNNNINFGGSGLYLAPRDMARLGYLYMQKGRMNGVQILPEEWIELSTQNTRKYVTDWGKLKDVGYGFQWWTGRFGNHPVYFAAGFGGQFILNIPDLQMIVVSTMNVYTEGADDGTQFDFIIDLVSDYIIPSAE